LSLLLIFLASTLAYDSSYTLLAFRPLSD